jgi:hypothetical protein
VITGGAVEVHSNWVDGGSTSMSVCTSAGVRLAGTNRARLRNNIIRAGTCVTGANVYEDSPGFQPELIESNAFEQTSFVQALYRGAAISDPRTAADLNALTVTFAQDNFSASCPLPLTATSACVDAGTIASAPAHDFEGQPRVGYFPDVGPDEWGDLPRPCAPGIPGGVSCGVFQELSAKDHHVCGLQTNGLVRCWGTLQLGAGDVPPFRFRKISMGLYHGCGIRRDDAALACWGDNTYGQARPPAGTFKSIASGRHHSCGVKTDGSLLCWGLDGFGEPLAPPAGTFSSVGPSAGIETCAVDSAGMMRCFGSSGADGSFDLSPGGFQNVGSGLSLRCGRGTLGSASCWAPLTATGRPAPSGIIRDLSVGYFSACSIGADGALQCLTEDQSGPELTPPAGTFKSVSVGWRFACAIRSDDAVVCWGDNSSGQLDPP